MSVYKLGPTTFALTDGNAATLLAAAHAQQDRPLCLCMSPGVPMYVSKVGAKFFLKRMPNSGSKHNPACESYEPPPELSGLGELAGSAIQENVKEGVTTLRLGFGLAKAPGRAAPAPSGKEAESVKTDGKKLTLRATMHYLWDQAGFNRWTPAMQGKRNWSVVRKFVLQAAQDKRAKGGALDSVLFLPEPFVLEQKDAIARRRQMKLAPLATVQNGNRKLMLLIGEVKDVKPARFGHKIVVKHLADFEFMVNDDLLSRVNKRFGAELELWRAHSPNVHLILAGTFGLGPSGVPSLEEVTLMTVNDQWVPIEGESERMLLEQLARDGRRFVKGLRYNLDSKQPLASVVVHDTHPAPVAMYLIPATASGEYLKQLADLINDSSMPAWIGNSLGGSFPPLPQRDGFVSMSVPTSEIAATMDDVASDELGDDEHASHDCAEAEVAD